MVLQKETMCGGVGLQAHSQVLFFQRSSSCNFFVFFFVFRYLHQLANPNICDTCLLLIEPVCLKNWDDRGKLWTCASLYPDEELDSNEASTKVDSLSRIEKEVVWEYIDGWGWLLGWLDACMDIE